MLADVDVRQQCCNPSTILKLCRETKRRPLSEGHLVALTVDVRFGGDESVDGPRHLSANGDRLRHCKEYQRGVAVEGRVRKGAVRIRGALERAVHTPKKVRIAPLCARTDEGQGRLMVIIGENVDVVLQDAVLRFPRTQQAHGRTLATPGPEGMLHRGGKSVPFLDAYPTVAVGIGIAEVKAEVPSTWHFTQLDLQSSYKHREFSGQKVAPRGPIAVVNAIEDHGGPRVQTQNLAAVRLCEHRVSEHAHGLSSTHLCAFAATDLGHRWARLAGGVAARRRRDRLHVGWYV
mmetsp:Transcript_101736/g.286876  ORF Transcript_101736/g.286876 Transcript_101736/m.286876 type:complete len:290 (-) Transcript_101736:406-1275(-)